MQSFKRERQEFMAQERLLEEFPPVSYDEWRDLVEKELNGASFEKKLVTRTYEGIEIRPIYAAEQRDATDLAGFPGFAPYLRGAALLGNVRVVGEAQGWRVTQECQNTEIAVAREVLQKDFSRGVRGFRMKFDRVLRGVSDAASEREEGVLIGSLADLDAVFSGFDLQDIELTLECGANAIAASALVIALVNRRGISLRDLSVNWGCDPLGALVRDGSLSTSLDVALSEMVDLSAWNVMHAPKAKSVSISTSPHHDAGANAVQEIAYALATGVEYLRALVAAGLEIDQAASQIAFQFSVGRNFFIEIAKLRAARAAWARIVKICEGSEAAQRMQIHARTSARTKTQRDPWVNLLRVTTEALAAGIGGADSVASSAFDEALGSSDDFGRRMASNTQQILIDESHIAQVIDPAGGSWYVEQLTSDLARAAWTQFQKIEGKGGMRAFVLSGELASEIDEVAEKRRQAIALRRDAITGVSEFPNVDEAPICKSPLNVEALRHGLVSNASANHNTKIRKALDVAAQSILGEGEKTQAAIAAAEAGMTLLEIATALHANSTPASVEVLALRRSAEPFERLRDACDAHVAKHGLRPSVFLANMGPIPKHKARATFARNFFEAAGLHVIDNDGFGAEDAAVKAFRESQAAIAVICSSDDLYEELVPTLARALRAAGAKSVILAGKPGNSLEAFEAAGVNRFIYIGCDVLSTLESVVDELGVER